MIVEDQLFRFKKNLKYIVIDTETESLNNYYSRPWEVSWLVVHGKEIVKKYEKFPLIKDLNLSKGAAKITRFDKEEYKTKAESAIEVYKLLKTFLYNPEYIIVGLNYLGFDIYQIAALQRELNEKVDYSYINRVYDVLSLGRAYKQNFKFPEQKEKITPWMYQLINVKVKGLKAGLEALCKEFKLNYSEEEHHSGVYDIIKTKEIFEQLYWKLEIW